MSEIQSASGTTPPVSDSEGQGKDTVAYDTYKRTVSEVKSLKSKLAELQAEKEAESQAKLAEQGKWKEKAELAEKMLSEEKKKANLILQNFGKKQLESVVKSEALKLGAKTEAIDDIIKVADFSDVEVDETFNINQDQIGLKLTELAKKKPYFFSSTSKPVSDVVPSSQAASAGGKKLEEMSVSELKEYIKTLKS